MRVIALLLSFIIAFPAWANFFNTSPKFLSSQEAFIFSYQQTGHQLALHWQIADGYYLYKKELSISGQQLELSPISLPPAQEYDDEFFGRVEIFRHELPVTLSIAVKGENPQLTVRYQGCTKGFCYPPETINLPIALQVVDSTQNFAKISEKQTASPTQASTTSLTHNEFSLFWFFVLGLGLAFTPCVLPMLPLLSAIVIGKQQRPNSLRAALLSLSYVQGMALTYTLLGLTVAAIGLPFQIALQSPAVLIGLAILFILLSLSMFGLFTLQLPHRWQQKLNQLSQQQQGGDFVSVFVMGMIAGLVASPCTSAPLSGALLYVAQSGDLFTGGVALYLLALGMGLPLMLITLFGNQILPKSGEWLLKVKTLFGFVILALPVFLLARVFPNYEMLMWSALALVFLIWLYQQLPAQGLFGKLARVLVFAVMVISLKPWTDLFWHSNLTATQSHTAFTRISSLAELQQQLALHPSKKAMLDLYADWCVACKEFERETFSDPQVAAKLAEMQLLQIDMTHNSAQNTEMMQQFNILGLPTILFFDETGKELTQARVTGFMAPKDFLVWLNQLETLR